MKGVLSTFFALFFYFQINGQSLPVKIYNAEENAPIHLNGNILQDHNGFIWFVEKNAVIKYNGKSFIETTKQKVDSNNVFTKIVEIDNKLLVLSKNGIRQIVHDSIKKVNWVKNELKSLIACEANSKNKIHFLTHDGIYILKNDSFVRILNSPLIKNIENRSSLIFVNDSLAISYTYDKNIVLFDFKENKTFELKIPALKIIKSKGEFYFFTYENGIEKFKYVSIKNNQPIYEITPICKIKIAKSKIFEFLKDENDNFWLTSPYKNLIKVDKDGTIHYYDEKSGIPSLWITNIYADREQNLWLSYYPGLCKVTKNNNQIYTIHNGLFSNNSKSLFADDYTNSFYILNGKGINRLSKNSINRINLENGNPLISDFILPDKDQLYAVEEGGLFKYKIKNDILIDKQSIQKFTDFQNIRLYNFGNDIYFQKDSFLFLIKNSKSILLKNFNQFFKNITIDHNNHFWVITMNNLIYEYSLIDNHLELYKTYDLEKSYNFQPITRFRSIITDSLNNIWVTSSEKYIYKYSRIENKWFAKKAISDDVRYSDIWNISETKNKLYISTSTGLKSIYLDDKEMNIVDERTNTKVTCSNQVVSLKNGWSCATNASNLTLFYYQDTSLNFTHNVLINNLIINGEKRYLTENETIKLNPNQNNISFVVSSDSYLNEDINEFSFSISKDNSTVWSPFQKNNVLNFLELSPGKYTFKVKSQNAQKSASQNIAICQFEILPAFWQTTWFLVLLILLPLSIIYLIFRNRFLQLKKLQTVRNNISRDLHDQLGSSISSISMLSNIALVKTNQQESTTQLLEQISKTALEAGESIDDIIWSNNPKFDNFDATFSRIRNTVSELLDAAGINYEIKFPNLHQQHFDTQLRRDLYLLCKEACTNIAKYSAAKKVQLTIEMQPHQLLLSIIDDGTGFDVEKALNGDRNGVKNLIQRAQSYKNGSIKIDSEIGIGTKIYINLPLKNGTNM